MKNLLPFYVAISRRSIQIPMESNSSREENSQLSALRGDKSILNEILKIYLKALSQRK